MYAAGGRPSIPPERLLKASLLIALYSVRSERAFCEELDYHLLFRWFLDMDLLEPSFDPTVFTKNRRRLLKHEVAQQFFDEVVRQAAGLGLLSDEHFTVDGTLIEAAASLKSFRPKDEPPSDEPPPDDPGNPTVNFHGERRSNATHQSTTDPEALLAKKGKGKEAHLSFMGHALMENRNGLLVDFQLTQATGTAEREAVPTLIDQARERGFRPQTLGADKGYDTKACVADLRQRQVTPHVTQNTSGRRSAIDRRTTRHAGLCHQSTHPQARRGDLRLDEDGRRVPPDALPRPGADPTGRLPGGRRLQPCPDGQADGCCHSGMSSDRQRHRPGQLRSPHCWRASPF